MKSLPNSHKNQYFKKIQSDNSIFQAGHRQQISELIGNALNFGNDAVKHIVTQEAPTIDAVDTAFKVGRALLPRRPNPDRQSSVFSITKDVSILLEFIAAAVSNEEPVLLVGETGVGKTSAVQYLCHMLGKQLHVVNLSQQTESTDLLGGFKPVDMAVFLLPIKSQFEALFSKVTSGKSRDGILKKLAQLFQKRKWKNAVFVMLESADKVRTMLASRGAKSEMVAKLSDLVRRLEDIRSKMSEQASLFAYVEGILTKAARAGDWVLLDEINLAEPEILESLSGIIDKNVRQLSLCESAVVNKHKVNFFC